MKILIVCNAGASSTFIAHRLRQAAKRENFPLSAAGGTESSIAVDMEAVDLLLVGAHLSAGLDRIISAATSRGVKVAILPDDIAGDLAGTRTLELVRSVTDPDAQASS